MTRARHPLGTSAWFARVVIMLFRTLLLMRFGWRRRPRLAFDELATIRMRAHRSDIDVLGHINNGVYLSLTDLARLDLLLRAGLWARMRAARIYPVVTSSTISYRKSIELGQRYTIETRLAGWDERSVFVEHRFVVGEEIYARGWIRGRFLRRGSGALSTAETIAALGLDIEPSPPSPELLRWADQVALPSTRAEAPSVWDEARPA